MARDLLSVSKLENNTPTVSTEYNNMLKLIDKQAMQLDEHQRRTILIAHKLGINYAVYYPLYRLL